MTSPVPPAPEEGVVVLWARVPEIDGLDLPPIYSAGYHLDTDAEYRALPAAAYDAMEAKASAYPDAMDMIRSLARQLAEAEARLAAAEKARDEAVAFLDMLFTSHWDGTIGRPPTWHLRGDFRHVLSGMRGKTLAEAIAALKRDGEG